MTRQKTAFFKGYSPMFSSVLAWQNELPHDNTNTMTVHPAKTQISMGIRPVWSESLLFAQWVVKDPRFLYADSEDSDQTGLMPDWSESSLGARSFCWFCHETAQMFNAIKAIKHDFLMHLHLLSPTGDVETLAFQARVFNTSIGAHQMLMHRKSCLIPILKYIVSSLSRRLIGELIVQPDIRHPSVRQHFQTTSPLKPWRRFLPKFTCSLYLQGERIMTFCLSQIRTLVAMATYNCHWLIMGKKTIDIYCYVTGCFTEILLE